MKIEDTIDFIDTAKEYANTRVPFKHRGMSREGCDCTGFIISILKEMGYAKDYVLRVYAPDWNLHKQAKEYILEELALYADSVDINMAKEGDILCFKFGRYVSHVGIKIENGNFVHCYVSAGCVKISPISSMQSRLTHVFRLRSL